MLGGGEGSCDTAGVAFIEGNCAADKFECCNGECIDRKDVHEFGPSDCGDWSDKPTRRKFITCPCKEKNRGLVECDVVVAEPGVDVEVSCTAASLSKIPTFVNPDVTKKM